ncbi:MAG: hypothetical protein O3C28_03395 [Proteobacteria bacterium]|nr:hypothetical protein [Pseudomonadota bacterium]
MRNLLQRVILTLSLTLLAHGAYAVPEMRVSGRVDANGDFAFESNMSDIENAEPFSRPSISVADQDPGEWEYLSLVDSTVPKLQVFGTITNTSGSQQSSIELGLMNVFASLRDTITITPTDLESPYQATVTMVVDGILDIDGSNSRVSANLNVAPQGLLSTNDFRRYDTSQTVTNDVLTTDTYQLVGESTINITSLLSFFVLSLDAGATATADFSNTAIVMLSITNLNGDPLAPEEITVTSESGNFGTAPVPLPATLPLLLSALLALSWRARVRAG